MELLDMVCTDPAGDEKGGVLDMVIGEWGTGRGANVNCWH